MTYRFLDSEVAGLYQGSAIHEPSCHLREDHATIPVDNHWADIKCGSFDNSVSMSGTAHAQTASESSITSGLSMSAQIRYAETSIERQPSAGKGEPAKSGAGNKNSQRLDRRQEMNREEKAGGSSSTDRNQGSQRKIRRALA